VLIFREDQSRFSRGKGHVRTEQVNAPNRRVRAHLPQGNGVDASKWPARAWFRVWRRAASGSGPTPKHDAASDLPAFASSRRKRRYRLPFTIGSHDSPCGGFFGHFHPPVRPLRQAHSGRRRDRDRRRIAAGQGGREATLCCDVEVPSVVKIRWSRPDGQEAGSHRAAERRTFEESLRASGRRKKKFSG
jgi:hypothetical protein